MIIKTDKELFKDYLSDASNFKGDAIALYLPENENEIIAFFREAYSNGVEVTISGSRTGLTASAVPLDGIVLSTEKLNKIIDFDEQSQLVRLQPGVKYFELNDFLQEKGFFLAPNPTEINASIGGNIATNASGSRTFLYGPMRDYVQYLKIILMNGEILEVHRGKCIAQNSLLEIESEIGIRYNVEIPKIKHPSTKNAAGYFFEENLDAIDLFIASEGTLGFISEIGLRVLKLPEKLIAAITFFESKERMFDFVNYLRTEAKSEKLLCSRLIEYFDNNSLDLLRNTNNQIPHNARYAIWNEIEANNENANEILEILIETIQEYSDLADDTWIAENHKDHEKFRSFRHQLPLAIYESLNSKSKLKIGTDSAVPLTSFREYYEYIYEQIEQIGCKYVVFGHIGDCHLHANMFAFDDEELDKIKQVYTKLLEKAVELEGTISAEHGIGKLKNSYFKLMYSEEEINTMKAIKAIFDDKNLLNIKNIFE